MPDPRPPRPAAQRLPRSAWRALTLGLARACAAWPNQCAACLGPSAGPGGRLCHACREAAGVGVPRCQGCALRGSWPGLRCGTCLREPPPWVRARAAFDHRPPWDRLVAAHKFHGAHDLGWTWADLLGGLARQDPPAAAGAWLLPVPMAPGRWAERGHAMTLGLARGLGSRLGWTVRADLVERVAGQASQRGLDAAARQANVRNAFWLRPGAAAVLAGQPVVMVDDVMTTGATLASLARTLAAAGAGPLEAWVLSRRP